MKSKYLLPSIFLVIGLGVGFTSGYYFKGYSQQKQFSQMRNGTGLRGEMLNGMGNIQKRDNVQGNFAPTDGEIISIDDKSVTIKLNEGSSKIVLLSNSTSFSNLNEAKKEDLKTGSKVKIFGKTNTDGSLTADNIQLLK